MATSGSVDFSVNRDQLLKDALYDIGAIAQEDTPSAAIIAHASRKLNMMLKAWQADGLRIWKNDEITIFTDKTKSSYSLGPTGDHAVLSSGYNKTEMKVAAVATDTSLDVDTTTGMAASDNIGIVLDDGSIHWTTISSVTDSDTVVITAAIETGDAAAIDNNVYWYTTKINRPLQLTNATLRNDDDNDTDIDIISREVYYGFSNKTTTSQISQIYYDAQTTNGRLYTYTRTDTVTDKIIARAQMPIEDMDSAANDFDCPQEWYLAIQTNLAVLLAPSYGALTGVEFKALKLLANEEKDRTDGFDTEKTSILLQPDYRGKA